MEKSSKRKACSRCHNLMHSYIREGYKYFVCLRRNCKSIIRKEKIKPISIESKKSEIKNLSKKIANLEKKKETEILNLKKNFRDRQTRTERNRNTVAYHKIKDSISVLQTDILMYKIYVL